jgi:hypothetical protein
MIRPELDIDLNLNHPSLGTGTSVRQDQLTNEIGLRKMCCSEDAGIPGLLDHLVTELHSSLGAMMYSAAMQGSYDVLEEPRSEV